MPMFGFDEQYPMFDVTPVDNQFILEYLPSATGDAVRVYLYGLMQCYHPQSAMTVEQMARELGMEQEAVLTAYRHWERRGLVKRIGDKPPTFRYVGVKQLSFLGGAVPVDEAYEAFSAEVYAIFGGDRRLHGKEMSQIYEWVEDMGLPAEVVLALLRHMVETNGKNVAIKTIEKRAMQLSDEKITTAEDALNWLACDKRVLDGARAVIRRMGKRRNPTEDEMALYRTWTADWGFTAEDVLSACAELTRGDPNFKYLDGILKRLHARKAESGAPMSVAETIAGEKDAAAPLKALLNVMNLQGVRVNAGTLAVYESFRALYPDSIILMAGEACARHRVNTLDDVLNTLQSWKRSGLETPEAIRQFLKKIDEQNDFLRVVYDVVGMDGTKPNAADRRLTVRWLEEWGFPMDFVAKCAAWAVGKEKPLMYLDKMLEAFHSKGIRTIEAARQERESFQQAQAAKATQNGAAPVRGPKVVGEQLYTQREYTHSEDAADAMMKAWLEEKDNA